MKRFVVLLGASLALAVTLVAGSAGASEKNDAMATVRQFIDGEPDGPIPKRWGAREYAAQVLGTPLRPSGRRYRSTRKTKPSSVAFEMLSVTSSASLA